ncbi:MAG: in-like serine protease [Bacteroidota bacterium]|nr:in-like serine protease [Bacteroidota bacterium]
MTKFICLLLITTTWFSGYSQFMASPAIMSIVPAGKGTGNAKLNCYPMAVKVPGNTQAQAVLPPATLGSLTVYPNPAADELWVRLQLPGAGNGQLAVYNYIGQKISELPLQAVNSETTQEINVSSYPSGIYFLSLSFMSAKGEKVQMMSQKIQVNH